MARTRLRRTNRKFMVKKSSPLFSTLAQGIWNEQDPKEILDAMLVMESLAGKDYAKAPALQTLFREVYRRGLMRSASMLLEMGIVPGLNTLREVVDKNSEMLKGRTNIVFKLPYQYWKHVGDTAPLVPQAVVQNPS